MLLIAAASADDTVTGTAEVRDATTIAIAGGRYRLQGIIPPEDDKTIEAAMRSLTSFVLGREVTCAKIRRLGHGYFLASCTRAANDDLAIHLLSGGLARADGDADADALKAQEAAKAAGKGVWAGS